MTTTNTNVQEHVNNIFGTITHFEDIVKQPEYKVKTLDKKPLIAKFITMLVKEGHDITPYVGKPLNWFNYDKIYGIMEEYEGKQLKLNIETTETIINDKSPETTRKNKI